MASLLGGHGKEKRVLPSLGVIHAAHTGQLPVNKGCAIFEPFGFGIGTHGATVS